MNRNEIDTTDGPITCTMLHNSGPGPQDGDDDDEDKGEGKTAF